MNGVENYNNEYERYAHKRIEKNQDKKYLKGFYYFMLSDGERSYSGAYNYLAHVINFVNRSNIIDPTVITLDDFSEYLNYAYKGKSSSHQIGVYSALKEFSKYLMANQYCDRDYMQFLKRPAPRETVETIEKREKGYMTSREIKKFLNNIKNSDKLDCWKTRDLAIAMIFLNTGIRCAALQKLDIDNIDYIDNTITVLEKRRKSRKIYISESTIQVIKDWLDFRDDLVSDEEHALFISNHKSRMTRRTIYNLIKGYGCIIDDKDITPHKMRGTFGTQLYNKTHDLYFVQDAMGHSNPKTTELYIRGQKKENAKKASDLMSGFLN